MLGVMEGALPSGALLFAGGLFGLGLAIMAWTKMWRAFWHRRADRKLQSQEYKDLELIMSGRAAPTPSLTRVYPSVWNRDQDLPRMLALGYDRVDDKTRLDGAWITTYVLKRHPGEPILQ